MDLFHGVGELEAAKGPGRPFGPGIVDHPRVHLLELVGLAVDGLLEILLRGPDPLELPQVGVGVDRLRLRRGPEQLRRLFEPLLLGLLRESEIFPVGLGLSGEGLLQIFLGFGHIDLLLEIAAATRSVTRSRRGQRPGGAAALQRGSYQPFFIFTNFPISITHRGTRERAVQSASSPAVRGFVSKTGFRKGT